MKKAVPYYRVSTERQGESGLGLEAQQKSVRDYAKRYNITLLNEFIEIESGRNNKRQLLQEALAVCEKEKAILLIAKLDRLSRSVAFISRLMESDVEFVAVDNPHANKLVVHIMAAFAEFEAREISRRTKDALKAAKKRGVKLGVFGSVLAKRNKKKAAAFVLRMNPIIKKLQKEGFESCRELTEEMNRLRIPTYLGNHHKWHPSTVCSVLARMQNIKP